jgi:peptide/nickel transport system ATP-binding protein
MTHVNADQRAHPAGMSPIAPKLLQIRNLEVSFTTPYGEIRAVDDVSLALSAHESLGIVGESGSGKSVTALSVLRLVPEPPGRIGGGSIVFEGEDLLRCSTARMREVRGNRISMIFQEPMTSLNPVMTVGAQIAEVFRLRRAVGRREALALAADMLAKVSIPAPQRRLDEYPHQLSGGMRQRVMIAMALACDPDILIGDEPTTALDVTIQAQIVELIKRVREESKACVLLISHDIGLIAEMCERVLVMYAGRVVETGPVQDIFAAPLHPYTHGLLDSLPRLRTVAGAPRRRRLPSIPGAPPNLAHLPSGCAFRTRCPHAMPVCAGDKPPMFAPAPDRAVRCWLHAGAPRPLTA